MKSYNFAVVGATGMVGRKFLEVLEEYDLPINELYLFASKRSAGQVLKFNGRDYTVIELTRENIESHKTDIALFSAGGSVSGEFAPIFAECGAVVIDNSSRWRMDKDVPLVVPEVNPEDILQYVKKGIIANPNCSTIQAMPVLKPIKDRYGIKRVIYSTYQAVSGAGLMGYNDLKDGVNGEPPKKFPHPIAFNCIPHIDVLVDDGYYKEEQKMIEETRKILHDDSIAVTATCVRVPVYNGHSESVNVELCSEFDINDVRELLKNAQGVIVQDDPAAMVYPMPITASGHDEVFVGRLRRDFSVKSGLNMFITADNIRKGAASNAVQIAREFIKYREMGEC